MQSAFKHLQNYSFKTIYHCFLFVEVNKIMWETAEKRRTREAKDPWEKGVLFSPV